MRKNIIPLLVFSIFCVVVLLTTNALAYQASYETAEKPTSLSNTSTTINLDGDVSMDETANRFYWNPHSTGLTNASVWSISFNNATSILLKTSPGEAGHVATGAWWTNNFKSKTKIPLSTSKPFSLIASFRVNVISVNYEAGNEWLRMALACAMQRSDGTVVYTELDFWDSPNTLKHPYGNTRFGGNMVCRLGDVVEYKIDQTRIGEWTNHTVDLTRYIDQAWSLKSGDALESVYFVVETMGAAINIEMKVDDLWITQTV
jgi:hypothetical protein